MNKFSKFEKYKNWNIFKKGWNWFYIFEEILEFLVFIVNVFQGDMKLMIWTFVFVYNYVKSTLMFKYKLLVHKSWLWKLKIPPSYDPLAFRYQKSNLSFHLIGFTTISWFKLTSWVIYRFSPCRLIQSIFLV